MGGGVRKQYRLLGGVPLLARAAGVFAGHETVRQVVIVVPPGDESRARKILKSFCSLDKLIFVEGGKRRQDSVYHGLEAIRPEAELVCIHDGARPLITRQLYEAVLEAARRCGAAIPVIPVTDTLKETAGDGLIKGTIPRGALRRAQTPQVFRRELIQEAYRKARLLGVEATDDAYLVELLGEAVCAVPGDPANIKVTEPQDLLIAAALLEKG